jgi:ACDE family multidrug resistance protein
MRRGQALHWPIYVGGFLGPFGGMMVTPMLPEVAAGLDTTIDVAAAAQSAYLFPFAALMVVSGTIAERVGRRRSVQVAYLAYAVASLLCLVAPDPAVFLAGRALQGVANAFTTPILLAALSDVVPRERLGGALGRFGSMQSAGPSFAPLIAGVAATVEWRSAFAVTAVAGLLLALVPPPDAVREPAGGGHGEAPGRASRWRLLLNRRLAFTCAVAALAYFTTAGLTLLATLRAADRFGLGPDARGVVVAGFGVCGVATGWLAGRAFDRLGWRRFGVVVHLALAASCVAAGLVAGVGLLAVTVGVAGVAATASRVGVNALATRSTPGNRGGASSMAMAWQFLGGAVAPLALMPVYVSAAAASLGVAALGALAAAGLLVAVPAVHRRVTGGPTSRSGSGS